MTSETEGIGINYRIVVGVSVEVVSTAESDGIFRNEPAGGWVVVSGPVIVEAGFRVEFTPRVLERVGERAGTGGLLTEGVERVRLCQCTGCVAQRRCGAKTVGVVITGRRASQHCQWFVDVFRL